MQYILTALKSDAVHRLTDSEKYSFLKECCMSLKSVARGSEFERLTPKAEEQWMALVFWAVRQSICIIRCSVSVF